MFVPVFFFPSNSHFKPSKLFPFRSHLYPILNPKFYLKKILSSLFTIYFKLTLYSNFTFMHFKTIFLEHLKNTGRKLGIKWGHQLIVFLNKNYSITKLLKITKTNLLRPYRNKILQKQYLKLFLYIPSWAPLVFTHICLSHFIHNFNHNDVVYPR